MPRLIARLKNEHSLPRTLLIGERIGLNGFLTGKSNRNNSPFIGNFTNEQGQYYKQAPARKAIAHPGQVEPLNRLREVEEDPNALRILSFHYPVILGGTWLKQAIN